ncbi:hypothetical protein V1514DRAFT_335457 [Lipomyces japonicus]|uniref:uncharacterized protein n=1 Tax=Lipomyces japonicus TaxID=56871 RepID=UPI0034CFA834
MPSSPSQPQSRLSTLSTSQASSNAFTPVNTADAPAANSATTTGTSKPATKTSSQFVHSATVSASLQALLAGPPPIITTTGSSASGTPSTGINEISTTAITDAGDDGSDDEHEARPRKRRLSRSTGPDLVVPINASPKSAPAQALTPSASSAARRSHLKSRNGCVVCKRRKIKCDEGRPQCRNCVKHNVTCSYVFTAATTPLPSPSLPAAALHQPQPQPQPQSEQQQQPQQPQPQQHEYQQAYQYVAAPPTFALGVSVPVPGALPGLATRYYHPIPASSSSTIASGLSAHSSATTFSSPPTFMGVTGAAAANGPVPNLTAIPDPSTVLGRSPAQVIETQQLALVTNFTLNTSKSLSNNYNPRSVYMWTHEVPTMACEFNFMMYSVLALSATHMQYLRNDPAYENIAVYFRHRAIESFRSAIVSDVKTPKSLEALILAGTLVSIDAFAYVETGEYANRRSVTIDRWLPLLLGIKAVVIESDNMAAGSAEGAAAMSLHWNPHIHFLPVGERSLLYLSTLIDKRATDLNQSELTYMCERPIRVLEQLITFNDTEFVELGAGLTRYIMTWPFVCSDEFIQKLKLHDHVALAIYVHYLAVMSFTKVWWQEHRVKNDVKMICKILGREWEEWLQWPMSYFEFDLWSDD